MINVSGVRASATIQRTRAHSSFEIEWLRQTVKTHFACVICAPSVATPEPVCLDNPDPNKPFRNEEIFVEREREKKNMQTIHSDRVAFDNFNKPNANANAIYLSKFQPESNIHREFGVHERNAERRCSPFRLPENFA